MYILINKDSERDLIKRCQELEQDIVNSIREGGDKFECRVKGEGVRALVEMAWDLGLMKKGMADMQIDTERVPMGKITREQVAKSYTILSHI